MDKRVKKNMKKLNEILKRPHSVGDSPEVRYLLFLIVCTANVELQ